MTEQFVSWKKAGARKPFLLYGARQAGKTFAVREFAKEHFDRLIEINFEREPTARLIFEGNLDPNHIIDALQVYLKTKIDPERNIIFFDEVQKCPPALTSLKYFAENAEQNKTRYHLFAAGSLLGITLHHENERTGEQFTFPVGKVEITTAYPMDFEEFLWAKDELFLADKIREHFEQNRSFPENIHRQLLNLFRQYLLIGGMPEAVAAFLNNQDYAKVHQNILDSYIADMTKYSDPEQGIRTIATYDSIHKQLGKENKKFQYAGIRPNAKSRDYLQSIQWLTRAHIALRCNKSKIGNMPLAATEEIDSFKLYLSDTGLLCHSLQITAANLDLFDQTYRGGITENYVAANLQSKFSSPQQNLHFWKASEKSGSAELEFLIATDHGNIPIEVKTSDRVRSRSLEVYIKRFAPYFAIRVSSRNFGFENGIKAVPLYSAFCIEHS
jgi:predicted AAA+ superfamily ATPase